ncbi:EKC/KEOPS complex subunit Gon7p [Diutina catenulata]
MALVPTAEYSAPDTTRSFTPGAGPHTTQGKTTQISDVVTKAGGADRDRPSEAAGTPLGQLRAELTTLQDQINVYLTERMQQSKAKAADDIERIILDEGNVADVDK